MPPSSARFGLFNTEERIIHSAEVSQDYQIGVWFPFSYAESDRRYPVLYVPDAEFVYGPATGLIPMLIGAEHIPELIVVGIGYVNVSGWQEHGVLRDRDFCPPGFQRPPGTSRLDAYTHFYQRELFPLIEGEYRGSAEDRGLFGFSSGGLFTMHALLTQPGMFRRHIAAACTWPGADEYLLQREREYGEQPVHPPTDLYLSVGDQDKEQLPGFERVTKTLRGRNYPRFRMTTEVLAGEGHNAGTLAKAFLYGVRAVYRS